MKRITIFIFSLCFFTSLSVYAQKKKTTTKKTTNTKTNIPQKKSEEVKDTSVPTKVVVVTSSFKPVLRTPSKINFSGASALQDSVQLDLNYAVPIQNLTFSYLPANLSPLAALIDTSKKWKNHNTIKLGYGNYQTPYGKMAFSFGNGEKTITQLEGFYTASKGKMPFQENSVASFSTTTIFNMNHPHEWKVGAKFNHLNTYQYGYTPATLTFTREQLRQRFNTVGVEVGVNRKMPSSLGVTYQPHIQFTHFTDNEDAEELNLMASAPINKTFGKLFAFDLQLNADLTELKLLSNKIKNNIFTVAPSIQFNTPNVKVNLGARPTWDNQLLSVLPNVTAELRLDEQTMMFEAGWQGYFIKNNYQSLAQLNPWLQQPVTLKNTKIEEQFIGLKGSTGNHFTYATRLSLLQMSNQVLFVNDTIDGKTFLPIYESKIKALKIHGEIGYTVQEKLEAVAGFNFYNFSSLVQNEKAWGLVPVELNASIRWKMLKDLSVKSDIFIWDGARYRNLNKQAQKLGAAADINIGLEYGISNQFNLWLQMNNLLNARYERWHQYPVFGFNLLGGIVYSF